jgi:hypothetical protein
VVRAGAPRPAAGHRPPRGAVPVLPGQSAAGLPVRPVSRAAELPQGPQLIQWARGASMSQSRVWEERATEARLVTRRRVRSRSVVGNRRAAGPGVGHFRSGATRSVYVRR